MHNEIKVDNTFSALCLVVAKGALEIQELVPEGPMSRCRPVQPLSPHTMADLRAHIISLHQVPTSVITPCVTVDLTQVSQV